jgi:hypothetical protein
LSRSSTRRKSWRTTHPPPRRRNLSKMNWKTSWTRLKAKFQRQCSHMRHPKLRPPNRHQLADSSPSHQHKSCSPSGQNGEALVPMPHPRIARQIKCSNCDHHSLISSAMRIVLSSGNK